MNKRLTMLMAAALTLLSAVGHVSFISSGVMQYRPIQLKPDRAITGLDSIFVVYDTQEVSMTFTASTDSAVTWCTYDLRTWGSPDTILNITRSGRVTMLDKVIPNKGYIIEEGTRRHYYWVVNYADYYMELNDMFIINDPPCSLVNLRVDGIAHRIPFASTHGHNLVLDREIELSYNTLVWDDSLHWQEQPIVEKFESLDDAIVIDPPLCNTEIILSGDQFLKAWGIEERIEGTYFQTQAVGCGTTAVQEDRGNDNEKGLGQEGLLGGSAPVHIVFTGYPTDAVVYRVWEMATDQDFENVILQYNQDEVDYTFNDYGTYFMRYMVANASGSCESYSDTYTITVSESYLECPNAFSPGSTPGVNDVWKVSYKSLVEFHCWIFNRWGNLVYEYTDPGGGWDGYYHGKLVDTGVYYYVITAVGSDGVKYKRRGDITILRYKKGAAGTSGGMTGGETGF